MLEARDLEDGLPSRSGAFLLKGIEGQRTAGELKDATSFFEGVPDGEVSIHVFYMVSLTFSGQSLSTTHLHSRTPPDGRCETPSTTCINGTTSAPSVCSASEEALQADKDWYLCQKPLRARPSVARKPLDGRGTRRASWLAE